MAKNRQDDRCDSHTQKEKGWTPDTQVSTEVRYREVVPPYTPDVIILSHNQLDITLAEEQLVNAAQLPDFRYCGSIPERITKDQPSDDISYRHIDVVSINQSTEIP